ncbi:MAG: hypothetical protein LW805_03100 [Oxalobacteraceae bacterium]|nr:hypothetical protein [Oxalobacteraceae bacterium]
MSIPPTKLLILASENGQGKWYARLDKDSKAQEVTLVFYQREGKRSLPQRISDKLDGIMSARSAASKYIESMGWCPIAPSSPAPTNVRALGGRPPRKPEALASSTKFRKPEVSSKTLSDSHQTSQKGKQQQQQIDASRKTVNTTSQKTDHMAFLAHDDTEGASSPELPSLKLHNSKVTKDNTAEFLSKLHQQAPSGGLAWKTERGARYITLEAGTQSIEDPATRKDKRKFISEAWTAYKQEIPSDERIPEKEFARIAGYGFDYLRQKVSITDKGRLERIAEALIPLIKSNSSSQLANDVLQPLRFSPWSKNNINEFAQKLASSMVENDIDEETDADDYQKQALDTIQALLTRLHEALDTNKTPLNQSEVEQANQFLELVAERENFEPETNYLKMLINRTRKEQQ